MTDLTKEQVELLLGLQGYRVPPRDLEEIAHRLNALMDGIRDLERYGIASVEPWPVQPQRRNGNGG